MAKRDAEHSSMESLLSSTEDSLAAVSANASLAASPVIDRRKVRDTGDALRSAKLNLLEERLREELDMETHKKM